MNCLLECQRLLKLGASVLFFPEGTRSTSGRIAAFKKVTFSFCNAGKCVGRRQGSGGGEGGSAVSGNRQMSAGKSVGLHVLCMRKAVSVGSQGSCRGKRPSQPLDRLSGYRQTWHLHACCFPVWDMLHACSLLSRSCRACKQVACAIAECLSQLPIICMHA